MQYAPDKWACDTHITESQSMWYPQYKLQSFSCCFHMLFFPGWSWQYVMLSITNNSHNWTEPKNLGTTYASIYHIWNASAKWGAHPYQKLWASALQIGRYVAYCVDLSTKKPHHSWIHPGWATTHGIYDFRSGFHASVIMPFALLPKPENMSINGHFVQQWAPSVITIHASCTHSQIPSLAPSTNILSCYWYWVELVNQISSCVVPKPLELPHQLYSKRFSTFKLLSQRLTDRQYTLNIAN